MTQLTLDQRMKEAEREHAAEEAMRLKQLYDSAPHGLRQSRFLRFQEARTNQLRAELKADIEATDIGRASR